MLIDCLDDISTGFNWDEYTKWISDYTSGLKRRLKTGNSHLRYLWSLNRRAMESYGFGRTELLPIRSSKEAIALYVGKYISKQIGQRAEKDKGVRLVSSSAGFLSSSPKFAWNTPGGKRWREDVFLFANLFCCCSSYEEFVAIAGPKWAFLAKESILGIRDSLKNRFPGEPPF